MNKLKLVRDALAQIVEDIDAGNTNLNEEQYENILEQISFFANSNTKYSKYQAAKYLKISRATFDNYVKDGKLPKGRKQQGFKEIFWTKEDLETFKKNK